MPKREDIKKIFMIGAGPIVIGQACEFDYSGTQACKALKEEGYKIVLLNSNPATIMTDPDLAHFTYIEPVTFETATKIIEKEKPDALLPTLGGQTALNVAVELSEKKVLERNSVKLIGASLKSIKKAENREFFGKAMNKIGLRIPKSRMVTNVKQAFEAVEEIGFPIIARPSFTLGGKGGGIAYNSEELAEIAKAGIDASIISQVMLEESVLGWKEYELEIMRDGDDNAVIICSIENIDPMGIHTGDSITVAPAQTLSDKQYQKLRDASIAIVREIGVDTGGSNVQFAVNPKNSDIIVVEMNPRVSRSSALASKATGFPIAKIAAKLAVGYSLDEIKNDITGKTLASFEPVIDYCVVKIPRWTFEKFSKAEDLLTISMKSVGETMAIGRTFKEAFQKALRSLETGRSGFGSDGKDIVHTLSEIKQKLAVPNSQRIFYLKEALEQKIGVAEIYKLSGIDPWFLYQFKELVEYGNKIKAEGANISAKTIKEAKKRGFSDIQLSILTKKTESEIGSIRLKENITPVYKLIDTCAGEFEAETPYYYSTYEEENEARITERKKVIILGGGPNRIGQGIEFDYCCVHAAYALKEEEIESIMINSNPETVSTDYDTSDKLYFEPLTKEDVFNIIEMEKPDGVIIQFGGQTPLNLADALNLAKIPVLGTPPASIAKAENRELFAEMLNKLGLIQPENGIAYTIDEALNIAETIGYPVMVRPSYVLGGRGMERVYDKEALKNFLESTLKELDSGAILIDKFLENAVELDVDTISDGNTIIIAGIMEHIEQAGIHSGDSACIIPPYSVSNKIIEQIKISVKAMAKELKIIGLMNVQYAVKDDILYVLEANPRASRTIPFVSKASGIPFAKLATKAMIGKTLKELGLKEEKTPPYFCVKEAVFPFDRFEKIDAVLGPEMKSTGEVMGIDTDLGYAYAKAQFAAGQNLPLTGTVLISVNDKDKEKAALIAQDLKKLGYNIAATAGTSAYLTSKGIINKQVNKISFKRPNLIDAIKNCEIQLIINTASGGISKENGIKIRRSALKFKIPYTTTIAGAQAVCKALKSLKEKPMEVTDIQTYNALFAKS
ncbi:MAG: carbamoyl-phosphate synthase large subunit [Deltaproteobacteria bacterium]|nr:carbamoyl-phosphate synthase large subunit [Deltaproteobacteria bacterium]